jgi:protein ImuB
VPGLSVKPRDEAAEAAALARITAWAGQFTPSVSLSPPESVLLEVAGSLALFGGLSRLLAKARRGLDALGYQATVAAAPTPLGASWLARAGDERPVTDRASLRTRLWGLLTEVLDLPSDTRAALQGLGLRCLADVLRLPRDGLARRFGPAFVDCLDKALGTIPDPRRPFVPPERFEARLPLSVEVEHTEALLFAARRLILELAGFLRGRGGGVQRLTLTLTHRDPPPTRLTLGLASPSRDPAHLLELLRHHLERTTLPAPVQDLVLDAGEILPLNPASLGLFAAEDPPAEPWERLLDRLRARLGAEAVRGLWIEADHRPERAVRLGGPGEEAVTAEVCLPPALSSGEPKVPWPLWLLATPLPLDGDEDRPVLQGLQLREGPERIESGWWDAEAVARDYFIAEHEGARLWVFRERGGRRRWFLHGIFA